MPEEAGTTLTEEQRGKNLLSVVGLALEELRGTTFTIRRRGVMFVATLLGHKMGLEQLNDQAWGTVGQCANCGQIAKAPREGDSIEGRAVQHLCPARKKPESV